jgi:hypothetical protein
LLEEKVVRDIEGIDRLYLNLYQPRLQTGGGVASFFKGHRGAKVVSTALMGPMSRVFVKAIHDFAEREGIDIITFAKGQRTDALTGERLAAFTAAEGILYRDKAQERGASCRVSKRFNAATGQSYPWLTRGAVRCTPLLCLPGGRGLRPTVHQLRLLLPRYRAGVPRGSRIRQARVGEGGDRLRGAG